MFTLNVSEKYETDISHREHTCTFTILEQALVKQHNHIKCTRRGAREKTLYVKLVWLNTELDIYACLEFVVPEKQTQRE